MISTIAPWSTSHRLAIGALVDRFGLRAGILTFVALPVAFAVVAAWVSTCPARLPYRAGDAGGPRQVDDSTRTAKTPADRFLDLVDQRIAPALAPLGFERCRSVLERHGEDVTWLVELELAPWTNPDKICFTLAWGVAVPGLDEILGDDVVPPVAASASPRSMPRLGEGVTGLEATWFTVGPVPDPGLDRLADTRTAQRTLRLVHADLSRRSCGSTRSRPCRRTSWSIWSTGTARPARASCGACVGSPV